MRNVLNRRLRDKARVKAHKDNQNQQEKLLETARAEKDKTSAQISKQAKLEAIKAKQDALKLETSTAKQLAAQAELVAQNQARQDKKLGERDIADRKRHEKEREARDKTNEARDKANEVRDNKLVTLMEAVQNEGILRHRADQGDVATLNQDLHDKLLLSLAPSNPHQESLNGLQEGLCKVSDIVVNLQHTMKDGKTAEDIIANNNTFQKLEWDRSSKELLNQVTETLKDAAQKQTERDQNNSNTQLEAKVEGASTLFI